MFTTSLHQRSLTLFFIINFIFIFCISTLIADQPLPPPPQPAHPCVERQPPPIKLQSTSHLIIEDDQEILRSDAPSPPSSPIPPLQSLPIKVIDIVPKYNENNVDNEFGKPYQLLGDQPIIVAFNRPIIALGEPSTYFPFKLECQGSDVPVAGHYRWVTTSIARFDVAPATGWPSDLTCQFSIDETLTSYDGITIERSALPSPVKYYTPSPSLFINSIISKKSSQMTNGEWVSYTPAKKIDGVTDYEDSYEVPPDAIIRLGLSTSRYNIQLIKESLRVYQYESKNAAVLKVTYIEDKELCGERDICISLGDQLEVNQYETYVIEIPQGVRIDEASGPLSKPISVKVNGLYPFMFYFIDQEAVHHRQRLYVRHSLAPSVTERDLEQVFSLVPPLPMKISIISPTVIQFEARLMPSTSYKLVVNPLLKKNPILDGWNLPLLAQSHSFQMSIGHNYITYARSPIFDTSSTPYPNHTMIYYQNLLESKKSISINTHQCSNSQLDFKMYAYPITKSNILNVLKTLEGRPGLIDPLKESQRQLTLPQQQPKIQVVSFLVDNANTVYTTKFDNHEAFKASGSYLQMRTNYMYDCSPTYYSELVQETKIGLTRIDFGSNNRLVYWVYLLKDATNVCDATVSAYGLRSSDYDANNLQLIDKLQTDKDGLVQFNLTGWNLNWVVVEYGSASKLFIFKSNTYGGGYTQSAKIKSELITDRKLYNAGETIYLKVYLNGPKPVILNQIFKVSVRWTILGTLQTFDQVVDFDDKFNTMNISIPIPQGTNFGFYFISLTGSSVNDKNPQDYYASKEILIADPRIPTGILEISSDQDYIKYSDVSDVSKITIKISTSNYIGEPSNNQQVKLSWRSANEPDKNDMVTVTTDKDGNATYTFEFPSSKFDIGNNIVFSAYYIDPTRATVNSNSLTRQILVSPYDIEIDLQSFSAQTSRIPNAPQGLNARMVYVPTGETIENVELQVKLTHWEVMTLMNNKEVNDLDQFQDFRKHGNGSGKKKDRKKNHTDVATDSDLIICTIKSTKKDDTNGYNIAPNFPQCTFTFNNFIENVLVVRGIEPKTNQVITQTLEITDESKGNYNVYSGYYPPRAMSLDSNFDLQLYVTHGDDVGNDGDSGSGNGSHHHHNHHNHNHHSYHVGDKVVISYWNPFKDGARALMYWGCDSRTLYDQFPVEYGFNNYTIKILKKCHMDGMFATLSIQGHQVGFTIPPDTFSLIYDQQSPKSASGSVSLSIETAPTLNLTISLESEVVSPDSDTTITLHINQLSNSDDSDDKPLPKEPVEACVMVVDKRILDLAPSPLSNSKSFSLFSSGYTSIDQSTKSITSRYLKQAEIMLGRLKLDQWISNWGNLDRDDNAFFSTLFNYLTNMVYPNRPYRNYYGDGVHGTSTTGGVISLESNSIPAPNGVPVAFDALAKQGPASPAPDTSNPSTGLRNNFKTTPLFVGKMLVNDGVGKVTFKLPDDITTFQVRAYVITSSSDYLYSAETSLTSRKDVNIMPIVPRFVRIGDSFSLGTSIVVSDPKLQNGIMRIVLKLTDPSIVESTEGYSKIVSLSNSTTTDTLFEFNALKKGTVDIGFFIYLDNRLVDSVEVKFDVLGRQLPMYVGTSMAVSSNTTVQEGIILPDSEAGTGELDLVVGVGRYPSVETMCTKLLSIGDDRTPSSVDQLSKQVTYAALTSYNANTTLINEAQSQLKVVMLGFDRYVVNNIKWYPTDNTGSYYPTLYALQLKSLMKRLKHVDGWVLLDAHFSDWQRYIDAYVNEIVTNAIQNNHTVDKRLIGLASIALGYYWAPSNDELSDLYSFNALSKNITDNCDLLCQNYFMIATLLNGDGEESSFIPTVIQNIENAIRIQGRTAYVNAPGGGRFSLTLTIYSTISFIMAKHLDTPFLEKMVNFIASGGVVPTTAFDVWMPGVSSEQLALSIIAMTCYDQLKNSNQPDLRFSAYKDTIDNLLLEQSFNSTSPKNVQKTLTFDQISKSGGEENSGKLLFSASGLGEVSVALGIDYVPTILPDKPLFNGFYVEKIIQFINNGDSTGSGNSSSTFKYGDYVQVVISVTTPDDVGVIYVEDPLSSVIEPLDNNIYQNVDVPPQWDTVRYYWYSPFGYRETRKDKVIFQGTDILAGSYTVSYYAVVTSSFGTYTLPPTKVYSPNQPELFGLSKASIISIH